jgi:hypothetical protein
MSRLATLAIEEAFAEEWGRIVAELIRRTHIGIWPRIARCRRLPRRLDGGRARGFLVNPARG